MRWSPLPCSPLTARFDDPVKTFALAGEVGHDKFVMQLMPCWPLHSARLWLGAFFARNEKSTCPIEPSGFWSAIVPDLSETP
jgi:hypothetical protein